ncbi:MAG TPA: TraB/GumN family protein [Steroidobacteraceae bacterium]
MALGRVRGLSVAAALWVGASITSIALIAPASRAGTQPAGTQPAGTQPAGVQPAGAPAAIQLEEIDVVGERPGPRLWKVTRGDHVLWVLGTLNHVPRKMIWRSSEVEAALSRSQQVLASGPSVSANIGPIAMIRLYFQWRGTQKDPNRTSLKDWLSPALYARFEALKARFDAHDGRIEELRPAFAAYRLYERAVEEAGLTRQDEAEKTVLKLAARRHVPVRRAELAVTDPSGALKEVGALPPSVEVGCLATTITRLETDLPAMQERAEAWAIGDVDRLRRLSFPDQREACIGALSNAPRIKALFDQASAAWDSAAEAALATDQVSFAMRPIYDLLAADGPLARFRAHGDTVEGP